jgi:membrane fusion protein, multidrug efflux system
MSVEIEVGLENAANVKVPPPAERERPVAPAPDKLVSPKLRNRIVAGVLVLAAIAIGLFLYYHNRETTDDAQVDGHITPIASKIYGRVLEVKVRDNEHVKAGQILVQIDPADYQAQVDEAKAALALAEGEARSVGVDVPRVSQSAQSDTSSANAQLAGANADLMRAQSTYDQSQTADIAYAQANVEKSRANAELAQADLARYKPLMEKGEISKQQYDAAKANADATSSALVADQKRLDQAKSSIDISKAQLEAARAKVLQMQSGVESARADLKRVDIRSADSSAKLAKVDQERAALAAAELNLSYCTIVAPVDGVVTHKQVELGQIVQQGQGLMVVVPLQDVWITANYKETQLRDMKPGQKAYIKSDTYGTTFTGHVDSISGATGAVISLLPPENATGNYVKIVQRVPVKIVLDPIDPNVAILRPGMNVDATVITK